MNLRSLIPVGRSRLLAGSDTQPFGSLQREINRLFEDFATGFPGFGGVTRDLTPTMDVLGARRAFRGSAFRQRL